ncbi:MAG TPA: hypothetical protein VFA54_04360 [Bryobacterales bacterium]|jgi:hypothetical protein|nr:hypothetical protein [Bryobacterales bacterium]
MAASPYRSTVTIDGTKFDAVSVEVVFSTQRDRAGMPEMGSLQSKIRVWADAHDDKNLPHSAIQKFFDLANVVTRDKIKDMKIEFWKDDAHQDALCSFKFKGWISAFETSNPANPPDPGDGWRPYLNHALVLDLEPAMNDQHFQDISISN